MTLPLVIAFSGRVPLGGVAANLLAGPVIPVITVVGTLAAVAAPIAAPAAALAVRATGPELWWVIAVARWCARIGVVAVPGGAGTGVALVVACVVVGGVWKYGSRGGQRARTRGGGDRGPPGGAGGLGDRRVGAHGRRRRGMGLPGGAGDAVPVTRIRAGDVDQSELVELLSPSLFAEERIVVLESAGEAGKAPSTSSSRRRRTRQTASPS